MAVVIIARRMDVRESEKSPRPGGERDVPRETYRYERTATTSLFRNGVVPSEERGRAS